MKQKNRNWLTTGQAAQLCAVTPGTVLGWIRKGRLEGVRTAGGHYRIKREKLERLLWQDGSPTESEQQHYARTAAKPLHCWEYLSHGKTLRNECSGCVAYLTRTARCFLLARKESGAVALGRACPHACGDCVYYRRVLGLPTRVLVITTDRSLADRVHEREAAKLSVRFADSVYETSAIAQSFPPAFAVIDTASFPIEDGGLVESLSRDPRLPGLKIIVASPGGANRIQEYSQDSNVTIHVIDRPFGFGQITAVIESYPVESLTVDEAATLGLYPEGEFAMQKHGALLDTELNEDGFLNSLVTWSRSAAEELAEEHDIGPLTEDHWKVIDFVQQYYRTHGRGPEVVKVHKETGLSASDICRLFPCGMVKGAYRLAGLPRPAGCG